MHHRCTTWRSSTLSAAPSLHHMTKCNTLCCTIAPPLDEVQHSQLHHRCTTRRTATLSAAPSLHHMTKCNTLTCTIAAPRHHNQSALRRRGWYHPTGSTDSIWWQVSCTVRFRNATGPTEMNNPICISKWISKRGKILYLLYLSLGTHYTSVISPQQIDYPQNCNTLIL